MLLFLGVSPAQERWFEENQMPTRHSDSSLHAITPGSSANRNEPMRACRRKPPVYNKPACDTMRHIRRS